MTTHLVISDIVQDAICITIIGCQPVIAGEVGCCASGYGDPETANSLWGYFRTASLSRYELMNSDGKKSENRTTVIFQVKCLIK